MRSIGEITVQGNSGTRFGFMNSHTGHPSGQIGIGEKEKTEYGSIHSSVLFTVTGYF